MYNLASGTLILCLLDGDWATNVLWSRDGSRLFSGSQDGTICCWDSDTGEQIGHSWTGHTRYIPSLSPQMELFLRALPGTKLFVSRMRLLANAFHAVVNVDEIVEHGGQLSNPIRLIQRRIELRFWREMENGSEALAQRVLSTFIPALTRGASVSASNTVIRAVIDVGTRMTLLVGTRQGFGRTHTN